MVLVVFAVPVPYCNVTPTHHMLLYIPFPAMLLIFAVPVPGCKVSTLHHYVTILFPTMLLVFAVPVPGCAWSVSLLEPLVHY